MKYNSLQILRIANTAILLAIITLVMMAYFRMDNYFSSVELKEHSTEFQLFVWGIILLSTSSFFINWRLILTTTATNADKADSLKDEITDIIDDNKDYKEYSIDINSLFADKNNDFESDEFIKKCISNICRELDFDLAVSFKLNDENEFENWVNYALYSDNKPANFELGDGLHGQVAFDKKAMIIKDIPENYLKITSGSGDILPNNVYIIPVVVDDKTKIVMEFADMKSRKNNCFELLQNFADEYSKILKA
jgi:hypothetical protein